MIHEFEMSRHNEKGVNCLDCHQPSKGQEPLDHKGFTITKKLSSANCQGCHPQQYDQYLKSRHAAPAWAAVTGPDDFTAEQIAFSEAIHKGAVDRPANALAGVEGVAAVNKGCRQCHDVGKPNADGSIGTCTACHARHVASVELARLPETCGQCHMGPDHSQLEIYHESKHGVLFNAQRASHEPEGRPEEAHDRGHARADLRHLPHERPRRREVHPRRHRAALLLPVRHRLRPPPELRARPSEHEGDLPEVPHQPAHPQVLQRGRERREVHQRAGQGGPRRSSTACTRTDLLTPEPFDEPIEYLYFDLWHYGGRTAKHGAYMGGADFVQWHGYYEIVSKLTELKKAAEEIRAKPTVKAVAAPKPARRTSRRGRPGSCRFG